MKEDIIRALKQNANQYISGERLSELLGVSRTAVWKWINQLKAEGYVIESQTKLGYRLVESPETLFSYEIEPYMNTEIIGKHILYFDTLDSTNNEAKRLAEKSFENGTVLIADEQQSGRGRLGRNWVSPKGKGIWLSVILKPLIAPKDASKMTIVAALAVVRAIQSVCSVEAQIKWPNDIVLKGKKLCGILTEMNAEMDEIHYLIVGIGVNVNLDEADFDETLLDKATSLKIETKIEVDRKILIASILNEFEILYNDFIKEVSIERFFKEYKNASVTIGQQVKLIERKGETIGFAEGLNKEGQLMVRKEDGTLIEVTSGEVSVRGIYGYV